MGLLGTRLLNLGCLNVLVVLYDCFNCSWVPNRPGIHSLSGGAFWSSGRHPRVLVEKCPSRLKSHLKSGKRKRSPRQQFSHRGWRGSFSPGDEWSGLENVQTWSAKPQKPLRPLVWGMSTVDINPGNPRKPTIRVPFSLLRDGSASTGSSELF